VLTQYKQSEQEKRPPISTQKLNQVRE